MARRARQKSEVDTYLIILKGDTELVFDDEDKSNLLGTAVDCFSCDNNKVLAYSFDDYDFRFVVHEGGDIAKTIKQICISFASFYNKKRNRQGGVFRDRYESICAQNEKDMLYMISAVHYCTQNEKFNSRTDYFANQFVASKVVLKKFIIKKRCMEHLKQLKASEEVQTLINKIATKYDDEDIAQLVEKEFETTIEELALLPNEDKRSVIEKIFEITRASTRQIVKVTGLPFRFVYSVIKATAQVPVKVTKSILKRNKEKNLKKVQEEKSVDLREYSNGR